MKDGKSELLVCRDEQLERRKKLNTCKRQTESYSSWNSGDSLTSAMLGSNHNADRADTLHMLCRVGTAQHSSAPPRRPSPSTTGHPECQQEVVIMNNETGKEALGFLCQ